MSDERLTELRSDERKKEFRFNRNLNVNTPKKQNAAHFERKCNAFERAAQTKGYKMIAGIEVGRGPLAG